MELAPSRDAPDALMLFDGDCNLCAAPVQAVLRTDREGVVGFASVQSPYGRALCGACGLDPEDPSTFLFCGGYGLPLPRALAPRVRARADEVAGRYRFRVLAATAGSACCSAIAERYTLRSEPAGSI